jgi:parallel beta-helix repeat protein
MKKMEKTMPIAIGAVVISVIAIASTIVLKPGVTIGAGDVGANELADDSVTGGKIVDGTITDADIATAGVSKIAGDAVGSGQIADNSITLQDLASDIIAAITGVENIADNSITSEKIADGAITSDDIGADAVGSDEIADGAVTSSEIANGTVTAADLATEVSDRLGKVATVIVAADGSGDYTDIQSAIDSLPASGGAVYIREGTYTISSSITVPDNVALIGAGAATKIYLADGADTDVISVSGAQNIIIADLSIDGNKANQTSTKKGIEFTNVENSRISGCWVERIYGYGIYFGGSSNNVITSNTVESNSQGGIDLHNSSNNNVVMGNAVRLNGLDGIQLGYASNNVLTGNVVMNNSQTIAGNMSGIYLLGSDYNVITSNQCIDDQTAKTQRYGVYISSIGCDKNLVVANVLIGNLTGGLQDSGAGTESAHNITA